MKTSSYTPAPWRVVQEHTYSCIRTDDLVIADMRYIGGFTNIKNAQLIATAPELLESLMEMVHWYEMVMSKFDNHHVDKARAVIAKAQGVDNEQR